MTLTTRDRATTSLTAGVKRDRRRGIAGTVRGDGPAQDQEYEEKRVDYFAAGTEIVWDVDPIAETIFAYRAGDPTTPIEFHVGDVADAEPVLPGWRLSVDDLFA